VGNRIHNRVVVFIELVIPKANHVKASRAQPLGSPHVVLCGVRFTMLRSIEFEDEFAIEADKVDDVRADGRLAAEFVTLELLGAQQSPEGLLGASHLVAEAAGEFALVVVAVHG
jgi:hypothetical protein